MENGDDMLAPNATAEQVLAALDKKMSENKLYSYKPYDWQKKFHNLPERQRMLMAANRVGKTMSAGAEAAMHATGIYPSWWEGKRFTRHNLGWVGSITNEASRDIVQKELLGGLGEALGTGWLPKDKITKVTARQAGISDVVDVIKVRHVDGKESQINFKTYDQGWRKWQGTAPDWEWLDEEPEDYRVFTEALTRILSSGGIMMVTFTPLLGETDLVMHFTAGKPGTALIHASWDDAPHLGKAEREELQLSYPEYERDARTKGVPMLGEGRVFTVAEKDIICEPFDISKFPWYAKIVGADFGFNHPGAASWLAWDRDADIVYLYDCYRMSGQQPVYHAAALKRHGQIPVAWPHDGENAGKDGSEAMRKQYADHGANMLPYSARYSKKIGGGQATEPIVQEVLERMKTGRFKVFSNQRDWLEEFRSFHRKNGKIVKLRDDIIMSTLYGMMMLRYAVQSTPIRVRRPSRAAFTTRVS